MNALIIVAHPDDEVIWASGYIQRHKNFQWFAISVCYGNDISRSNGFSQSCSKLGIYNHNILNYPDNHTQIDSESLKANLKKVIDQWVNSYGVFDYIFTHNKDNGEYGHEVHKYVGSIVINNSDYLFSSKRIIYQFNYNTDFPPNKQLVEVCNSSHF